MIKINLLPGKRIRKKGKRGDLPLFIALLAVVLCATAYVYMRNVNEIDRLQREIETTKQESARLEPANREYLALEKQKKEMTKRIETVNKIKEGRALAARMLYDLPSIMRENVWLKRFVKNDNRFELEGRSMDNESVSEFMEKLSKIPYMKNVELKSVEDTAESNITVKKFIVQGNVEL